MALRVVSAALMALVLSSGATPQTYPGEPRIVHYPLVHQVMCQNGHLRGTAFRIGKRTFATAAHVAANYGCTIDGKPISIVSIHGELDVAEIASGAPKGGRIEIDCGGFQVGHWYYAVGNARGDPQQLMVPVYAIAQPHMSGMQLFKGPELFVGGMSGGPVMDETGRAVGIVNARNEIYQISFSRAFKDTALCGKTE